jgi:hypothetical protein
MKFHPDKCTVLRVTNKKKIIDAKYQLHGHTLESVTSAKYFASTLFISACVYGSQTVLAYSTSGRARVKYACSFILIDGIFRFLRRKPLTSTVRLFSDDTIANLTISNNNDAETLQKDLDKNTTDL